MRIAAAQLAIAALLVPGCAASVPIQLVFPSTGAFDSADLARIDVVRVAPDALGSCPEILAASLLGPPPDLVYTLEPTDVCAVRAGLPVPDPGAGPFAFVAQILDDANTAILAGCSIAEAYPGAPAVRIELYPTDDYTAGARGGSMCSSGAP